MIVSATLFVALVAAVLPTAAATCDLSTLNTTSFEYSYTIANETIQQIADKFDRGVCDIGRANLSESCRTRSEYPGEPATNRSCDIVVDVSVVPNVGQKIIIPGQVCDPDWVTCIIDGPGIGDCLVGGPRLYYTLNGDTLWKIAGRLNLTLEAIAGSDSYSANATIEANQFMKVPLCYPSICEIEPFMFDSGIYKDLADEYGSTIGQIQMLSPTYNYSTSLLDGNAPPSISLAKNCRLLSSNYTILN